MKKVAAVARSDRRSAPTTRPRLIADIGGTNARFAIASGRRRIRRVTKMECADFASLADAAKAYLLQSGVPETPEEGAIAVASPITGDRISLTNHPWSFSREALRRRLGLSALTVVNDFTAIALSLPRLRTGERQQVGGGTPRADTPMAVLGPGTGLGVSALVPADGAWVALATEGGHVTMAAADEREARVLDALRRARGHVSAERVLSGPGLVDLYRVLVRLRGRVPEEDVTAAAIAERAVQGTCRPSADALDLFFAMLGTVASNLALSLGALGGVYIAGGIVPKLLDAFSQSRFRSRFEEKGRFSDYMAAIPTYVVTHSDPAFLGLAALRPGSSPGGTAPP